MYSLRAYPRSIYRSPSCTCSLAQNRSAAQRLELLPKPIFTKACSESYRSKKFSVIRAAYSTEHTKPPVPDNNMPQNSKDVVPNMKSEAHQKLENNIRRMNDKIAKIGCHYTILKIDYEAWKKNFSDMEKNHNEYY